MCRLYFSAEISRIMFYDCMYISTATYIMTYVIAINIADVIRYSCYEYRRLTGSNDNDCAISSRPLEHVWVKIILRKTRRLPGMRQYIVKGDFDRLFLIMLLVSLSLFQAKLIP